MYCNPVFSDTWDFRLFCFSDFGILREPPGRIARTNPSHKMAENSPDYGWRLAGGWTPKPAHKAHNRGRWVRWHPLGNLTTQPWLKKIPKPHKPKNTTTGASRGRIYWTGGERPPSTNWNKHKWTRVFRDTKKTVMMTTTHFFSYPFRNSKN